MSSNQNSRLKPVRLRDTEGRPWIGRATPEQCRRLEERVARGSPTRVSVNARGTITTVLDHGVHPPLEQLLHRFKLEVDLPSFEPYIPPEWDELLARLFEEERSARVLFYGAEGTGKDTIAKIFFQRLRRRHGADRVTILTIPAEENDRLVGHLETKAAEFGDAVRLAKEAGKTVACYLPEIESIFATGDYCGSWELHYKAHLRNVFDGTRHLNADYLLGSTNNLARLGGPLLSRFQLHHIAMNSKLAEGILATHWPAELGNGCSSDQIVEQLDRETIAEATLASRKKVPLRAADLTAFNGRFLAHLAGDIQRGIKVRRRKEPQFTPDQAFVDAVLQAHLKAMIAPAAEAAGTPCGRGVHGERVRPARLARHHRADTRLVPAAQVPRLVRRIVDDQNASLPGRRAQPWSMRPSRAGMDPRQPLRFAVRQAADTATSDGL